MDLAGTKKMVSIIELLALGFAYLVLAAFAVANLTSLANTGKLFSNSAIALAFLASMIVFITGIHMHRAMTAGKSKRWRIKVGFWAHLAVTLVWVWAALDQSKFPLLLLAVTMAGAHLFQAWKNVPSRWLKRGPDRDDQSNCTSET